jgi:outer membrane receptor protein involved in Fe transport
LSQPRFTRHRLLFAAASLMAMASAGAAAAQADQSAVEEVVVTATKQATVISKVPMSIVAVGRDTLDGQGVRGVEDLSRVTPSLMITNGNNPNGNQVTIRGMSSNVGAPTVGVYLDDILLTRRNANGAVAGNGTNFPQFFDLERVEVLRGPQGTLYGGSSIGGTIKFVLPQPSVTRTSLRVKAETSMTKAGDPSYEAGVSGVTPLVQDKLGLAASVYVRRLGGYIDHVSRFDGRLLADDTNSQKSMSSRVALLFKPTERLSITPSIYFSHDIAADQDTYWTNVGAYTVAATTTPAPTISGQAYTHPAFSYPAYNVFGPYRTGSNCNVGENFRNTVTECVPYSPRKSILALPSLNVSLDLGGIELKSLTSYTKDLVKGQTNNSFEDMGLFVTSVKPFVADNPLYRDDFTFRNSRKGWTQEFRISTDPDRRLSFVGGLYYSDFKTVSISRFTAPTLTTLIQTLYGRTIEQHFGGVNTLPYAFSRDQVLKETEYAAFGEATFKLTDKLRVLGGLRVARTGFEYYEAQYGTTVRRLVATPGAGLTEGKVKETPVSPKVGLQYFIDDRNMVFASATKGYRVGGVASRPAGTICDAELAQLGFGAATSVPFKSDSVWSYEVGAKVRPTRTLTLDASAYYVDWSNTQVNYRLNCQGSYVANAGGSTVKGVDFQGQFSPFDWLTLNGSVSYIDSRYDGLAVTIGGVTTQFINDGDRAPVPKWSYSLGANLHRELFTGWDGYFRADYQYQAAFPRSFGPGTNGFFPDVYAGDATHFASIRGGVKTGRWDISLFANNLFNSKDVLTVNPNGGRGNCTFVNGAITTCARDTPYQKQTTFRPRTVGLTATVRY